jgi:hypothetical protein
MSGASCADGVAEPEDVGDAVGRSRFNVARETVDSSASATGRDGELSAQAESDGCGEGDGEGERDGESDRMSEGVLEPADHVRAPRSDALIAVGAEKATEMVRALVREQLYSTSTLVVSTSGSHACVQ